MVKRSELLSLQKYRNIDEVDLGNGIKVKLPPDVSFYLQDFTIKKKWREKFWKHGELITLRLSWGGRHEEINVDLEIDNLDISFQNLITKFATSLGIPADELKAGDYRLRITTKNSILLDENVKILHKIEPRLITEQPVEGKEVSIEFTIGERKELIKFVPYLQPITQTNFSREDFLSGKMKLLIEKVETTITISGIEIPIIYEPKDILGIKFFLLEKTQAKTVNSIVITDIDKLVIYILAPPQSVIIARCEDWQEDWYHKWEIPDNGILCINKTTPLQGDVPCPVCGKKDCLFLNCIKDFFIGTTKYIFYSNNKKIAEIELEGVVNIKIDNIPDSIDPSEPLQIYADIYNTDTEEIAIQLSGENDEIVSEIITTDSSRVLNFNNIQPRDWYLLKATFINTKGEKIQQILSEKIYNSTNLKADLFLNGKFKENFRIDKFKEKIKNIYELSKKNKGIIYLIVPSKDGRKKIYDDLIIDDFIKIFNVPESEEIKEFESELKKILEKRKSWAPPLTIGISNNKLEIFNNVYRRYLQILDNMVIIVESQNLSESFISFLKEYTGTGLILIGKELKYLGMTDRV